MKRRTLCIFLAVVLLVSMFPTSVFAAHDSTGKPLDLTGDVYLALYVGGSDFPGEPAEHAVSGYLNLNASFGSTGFGKFAESAQSILEPSILNDVVQGTSGVWGVFSTTGGSRYLLPSSGIVDGKAGDVNKPHNAETEKKIIQTAINNGSFRLGSGESIDDYTIVWYVIKYQRSDSAWHIDGLITKKSTYSVNYYGNGNTSGGAPTGESGLKSGNVHTVLGNTGGLRKIVGNDTYIFNGWNTAADGTGIHYDAGDKITIQNANVNLYAEWYLQNKYTATVVTKLNGVETNIESILGDGITLELQLQNAIDPDDFIPMTKGVAGTYTATVAENGAYYIWFKDANGVRQKAENYQITIYNQNGRAELQYYSVSYDTNSGSDTVTWEGTPAPDTTIYPVATLVTDLGCTPVRKGYTFLYWKDQDGNQVAPGQVITSGITEQTVLTAHWQENINVTVEIVIDHNGGDGFNNADDRHKVLLQFLQEANGINLPLDQFLLNNEANYDETTHKTTYTLVMENVPQAIYKVLPEKQMYDVIQVTHEGAANTDQSIRILLKYAPDSFDLDFDVVVQWDNDAEKALLPKAVNVKVLYWGYSNSVLGWHTITQQANGGAPTTVYIDPETGKGTGSYTVWQYWSDTPDGAKYAYEYRIEITSFVMPDGNVVPATGNLSSYRPTSSSLYTATMSVENGGRAPTYPASTNLNGAYFDGNGQNGIPTATIDIKTFTVTFYAVQNNQFSGKLNNKTVLVLENQYKYPDLSQYIPVPDSSNYTFIGWYVSPTEPAQNMAGTYLTGNVGYGAQYGSSIGINGSITVAGTYQLNGETVNIKEVDRVTNVMVVLQKEINGQYMDVDSYEVTITYSGLGTEGRGDYSFSNLVRDGSNYRIVVLTRNYEISYDNESDYDISYSPDEQLAVLGGDDIAMVYAYLSHEPDSYAQQMEVDASQISQAFRPTGALAEILYRDLGDIYPYGVISQHTIDPYGKLIALSANGFGGSSDLVWQYHTDGTLYEYQMNVTKLYGNVDGVFAPGGTLYNSDTAPFIIEYDPASRYSAANGGQARTLKATLVPKEYEIIFDMGLGANESVEGMDSYLTDGIDGTDYYSYLHTWSYGDSITAFPFREGYVFERWESNHEGVVVGNDGGSIVVADGLAEDVTLTAIWRKLEGTAYTVRHLELNTEKPLQGAEVWENVVVGSEISAIKHVLGIEGYSYAGAKVGDKMYSLTDDVVLTVTNDATKNILTLYYVKDGYTDQVESNLKLDKTVILTNNGTYTINLETYTMDNPVTTMILQNTPLDIVLVLDQSGSIVQNGYLDDLQAAVDNFVEAVANHGRHNEVDHRIAIVGYASNATAGATNSDTKNYPLAGGTLNEWVNTGVFDSNGDFHPYPVTGFNYTAYTGTVQADGIYYTYSHDTYLLLDYHSTYHHLITEAEARETVLNGTKVYGYVYDKNDIGSFVELTRNASGLWLYGDKQLYSAKEFFTYHTDVWTHRNNLERREIHAYGTGSNFRCVEGHDSIYTRTETRNTNPALNIYRDALMPVSFGVNGSGRTNPNLIKATQSLGSNGGTYVQYGIEMANKIFAANPAEGRVRIMVTFTDGQPGNSGFDENIANAAIGLAYETKNTYDAYVYTIGLYPSTGVDSLSDVAVYMNAMSSNYPNAEKMSNIFTEPKYSTVKKGTKLNDGNSYYVKVDGVYYPIKYGTVTIYDYWWPTTSTCWYYTDSSGSNHRISSESAPSANGSGKIGNYTIYSYQGGGYAATEYSGYYSTTESELDLKAYFANIMTEITTNITTEIVLHGDTILRDIMGQGLVFTPNTVITAYKVAGHYNTATGQIEWSATKDKVAELSLKGQTASTLYSQATTDITFTNEDGTKTTKEDVPYISVYNYSQNVNKTDADKPHTVDITGYDFENNYIKEGHDGYKMVIEITSVEARDDVQWGRSTATNHERSGLWLPADENGNRQLLMAFNQPTTIFVERAYVLDYGKEFVLSDWYFDDEDGKDATPIHLDFDINNGMNGFDVNDPNLKNTKDSVYGNAQYGNVRVEDGKVIYSPTSMNWGGYDSFYVFGNTWRKTVLAQDANTNGNLWNKVTVIPANNIYYEDSFITTESTTQNSIEGFTFTGAWSLVGEDSGNTEIPEHLESAPYGDVHGWTDSLGDDVTFTDGSAHFVSTPGASAEFTFTGTGVEVYTRTNATSGMVVAVLNSKTVGEDGKEVIKLYKSLAMDNLAVSGDYYHIPSVAFKDLPYGTYTLQLIATVATGETGLRSEYYIDGVRIHNPLGNTTNYYSSTVKDAYGLENNAVFTEVRDILIDKNNSFNADQPNIGGAVFIDQIKPGQGSGDDKVGVGVPTYEIGTFEAYGPKNEVYLSAGQAIVLKVEEGNTYYMGLKSLKGGTVTANVSGIDQTLRPTAITITHSTDMYYRINPVDGYIVIQNGNTDGAILSVTNLRTTNMREPVANGGIIPVAPQTAVMMMRSFSARLLEQENDEPTEDTPKSPVQIHTEETLAFASTLFLSVRQWLDEN